MPSNPLGLTLKQRLAALALPSSSSPLSSPVSPRRRKPFDFVPPWQSRRHEAGPNSNPSRDEDFVLSRLIFQAGVDFETRPMVVINACALPDSREANYDALLQRTTAYLNLYVESDYTIIFFAAPGKHGADTPGPGWNWLWKAYRGLGRKWRKNLKQIYIVHPSFFAKMLFSLAGAIISPKFFRKIVYVPTLSELATFVPLTQIDIAPAVYQENLKHEKTIVLPVPNGVIDSNRTFGVPLEDIMGFDGEKAGIPRVVRDAIQFLREGGLAEPGLFRRSPSSALLRAAQDAYDRGNVVSLNTFGDPHLAAVLIKKYMRDLPNPVFPEALYEVIRRCPTGSEPDSIRYIREHIFSEIPPCYYILLSHVLHLMHQVSLRASANLMDAHNLALVLSPNLLKGSNPVRDVGLCVIPEQPSIQSPSQCTVGLVVKICISRYYEVFDELWDRSEARPVIPEDHQGTSQLSPAGSGRNSPHHEDEEDLDPDADIDDAMLVMPIGPNSATLHSAGKRAPPSAWGTSPPSSAMSTFKPRHRTTLSNASSQGPRSMHTLGSSHGTTTPFSSSKSVISIEKPRVGTTKGGGSIAIRRGTTTRAVAGKTSGAGVEAIGITAAGFFSAPAPGTEPPSTTTHS